MTLALGRRLTGVIVAPALVLVSLSVAGCHASFCAGSGCGGSGKIDFGTSYKHAHGGDFSIVGKKKSFKLGQNVAMVGHLTGTAGTKALTLKATRNGTAHSLTLHIPSSRDKVVAATLAPGNLTFLGVTHPGNYTFRLLGHSKQLAKGTLSER